MSDGDVWDEIGARHELAPVAVTMARRFAARGRPVAVIASDWPPHRVFVSDRWPGEHVWDSLSGQVVAAYRPDGTPAPRAA